MRPHKTRVRVSRHIGLPNKRDTPVKPALSTREKFRRVLPRRHYEAFPEEPEVEEMNVPTVKLTNPMLTSTKPVYCNPVLHLSGPALTENPRDKVVLPAAPANKKSGHRVSPAGPPTPEEPEAFKGGEMPVKGKEQNLTVTLESITSSSMESDTTFSSEDEDEEDCYSASTASSSLPSPEIFRRESNVETLTFPIKEELLDLHLHIKNSTLLDVSHAQSIHMHQPPNLSNITDSSTSIPEKNCDINKNRVPEAENKIYTDSIKSETAFKWKTPSRLTNRKPTVYKKKVWFKSPIIAETFKTKLTPATKLTIHSSSEPAKTSSPTEHMKPDTGTPRTGELNSKEEELQQMVTLKRPVKNSPGEAKFFDFINESDRDAFFKGMRDRCVKLKSAPLFPLIAPGYTD
ncbi:uncharacterized protein LOC125898385 [Epinephelus fuscoguttatus]|uniref:uncharacterized protein LOC125898385 n=1 Tax=Epinephelus fuscoguttatus TaxID=293821 RepID=UPI0020D03436|nr:uncharacterized protein LOC125898385 [Epinephelus fuscoguttatus]